MRIAIGNDHRGLKMKRFITELVTGKGHSCQNFGTDTEDSVDYPDIAAQVAAAVARGDYDRGILICGTGIGMCIAANKVRGIRAAQCHNAFSARRAREHNNINVMCLAAEEGRAFMPAMVEIFLNTEFAGGKHQKRLDKIRDMEAC